MRCDVNVSVRPAGQREFGTKVEVKNMNSFSAMQKAIDFEIARQSAALREGRGGEVVQETRLFDENRQARRHISVSVSKRCLRYTAVFHKSRALTPAVACAGDVQHAQEGGPRRL
jgi:aspartyl-tRNA(Asn)/glutamyl-tRNA(Gln) amidotransferase subunit B